MTAQAALDKTLDWNWGVPDWRDVSAYPAANDLTDRCWWWEFIAFMTDWLSH